MKLVHSLLLFVSTLLFVQYSKHVEGQLINFGIVNKVKETVDKVLHAIPIWHSAPSQHNATTVFPTVQTSQYVVPSSTPISSEGIQQQSEVSTLPQGSDNETVQEDPEGRALIDAPLINGQCGGGYRAVNGRCRKVFGRRRRR
jgi:hypothetical protein